MRRALGLIVAMVWLAGMLAGCGGTPEAGNGSGAGSAPPLSETGSSEAAGQETGQWPRTYVDALGREVVLEKKPEKPALLFFRNFEHLFLLDEFPAAATDLDVLGNWQSLAPYKDREIADLGSITSPNMEKLLSLEPDLIIMVASRFDEYGERMERIAPVVTVDSNENNWQGALREYGEMFGKERKAEEEIDRIETLIADARERLKAYEDKTFGVIMMEDKQFWAFTTQFVYSEESGLGLHPPDNYVDMSGKGEQISLEGLAAMNLDYMFVADIGGSYANVQTYLEHLADDAVWNSLPAVRNGQLHALDSSIAAGGPLGIELGVTTIVKNILAP